MANRRYWNWEDDDLTWDLSQWLVGIIEPGLYRGFDATLQSGMRIVLSHFETGAVRTLKNRMRSLRYGIIMTKQGVVFTSDESVTLQISPTNTLGHRRDLIIFEHSYEQITGGVDGTFRVIEGAIGGGFPELQNPSLQTIIARLTIPASTTDWILEDTPKIIEKPDTPDFAGGDSFVRRRNGFIETDLDARGNQIVNLSEPENDSNAATKFYVDYLLSNIKHATETIVGIARIATQQEVVEGTDNSTIIPPLKLKEELIRRTASLLDTLNLEGEGFIPSKWLSQLKASLTQFGLVLLASEKEVLSGEDNTKAVTPFTLRRALMTINEVFDIGIWNLTNGNKVIPVNAIEWWNKVIASEVQLFDDAESKMIKYPDGGKINIEITQNNITLIPENGKSYLDFTSETVLNRGFITVWKKIEKTDADAVLQVFVSVPTVLPGYAVPTGGVTVSVTANIRIVDDTVNTMVWNIATSPAGSHYTLVQAGTTALLNFDSFGQYVIRLTVTTTSGLTAYGEGVIQYTKLDAPIPIAVLRMRDGSKSGTPFITDGATVEYATYTGATPYLPVILDASSSVDAPNGSQILNLFRFEQRNRGVVLSGTPWDDGSWQLISEGISNKQEFRIAEHLSQRTWQFRCKVQNDLGGLSDWSALQALHTFVRATPPIDFYVSRSSGGVKSGTFEGFLFLGSKNRDAVKRIEVRTRHLAGTSMSAWVNSSISKVRLRNTQPSQALSVFQDLTNPVVGTGFNINLATSKLLNVDTIWIQGTIGYAFPYSDSAQWEVTFRAVGDKEVTLGKTPGFRFGLGYAATEDTTFFVD